MFMQGDAAAEEGAAIKRPAVEAKSEPQADATATPEAAVLPLPVTEDTKPAAFSPAAAAPAAAESEKAVEPEKAAQPAADIFGDASEFD